MGFTYKSYLLAILTIILAFNFVDRVALGVLLQAIKTDLHLSDTQLGFLSGIAFALFYSVMGIPIARWADRGNRPTIIALTAGLWSVAVALCGFAKNFGELLVIRVGVAVGEAGCSPPAFSLIADFFDRWERPRAVAIYGLGVPMGTIFAFLSAGWLNEIYGWRMTFTLLGAPGLLLALLARFTLREPRLLLDTTSCDSSRSAPHMLITSTVTPRLGSVCITLWANLTFRHLLLFFSISCFFAYGILTWLPALFARNYGMTTSTIGTWLALTYGLGGLIGSYIGGELATRCAADNESLQLRFMAVTTAASGLLSTAAYLSHHPHLSFILIGLSTMGLTMANAPLFATMQTLVPTHLRAVSFALVYLLSNLVGMGLGPLLTGAMSDALHAVVGDESVRYSLLILAWGYFWAGWHGWQASHTVTRDLESVLGSRDPGPAVTSMRALNRI